MATPTLVGTGIYSRAAGTTSKTVSHTLDAAVDMVVVFADDGNIGGGDISSITYNGVAMTRATGANVSTSNYQASIWYILDADLPVGGAAYDVTANYAANTSGTTPVLLVVAVSGAKQAAPDAVAGLSINTVDPITTAAITTVASATLIIQAIIGTQTATLSSWTNGQTTVNNQSARVVGTLTGPTPGGAQDMNADLSAAYTTGASLLISIEGAASAPVVGTSTALRNTRRRRR